MITTGLIIFYVVAAIGLIILARLMAYVSLRYLRRDKPWAADWWQSASTEMFGAFMTAVILAVAVGAIQSAEAENRRKEALVLSMSSQISNEFAREAIRQLKFNGWVTDGTLRNQTFVGAQLQDATLDGADMRDSNLNGALLQDASFQNANLICVNLVEAELHETDFTAANLTNADLRDATIDETDFTDADLTGANLRRSNLSDAVLDGAILTNADLRGASLLEVDMEAIADTTGIIYDDNTTFPDNWEPPDSATSTERDC